MKIIVDSRERSNMQIIKVLNERNIKWFCSKLEFGDYSFVADIDGQEVDFRNIIAIERKANLTEISNNFCRGRNQFETEFCKGKAAGCKMVLLVEDAKVREKCKLRVQMEAAEINERDIFRKTWRTRMTGNAMIASFKAFKERYDLEYVFCRKNQTADIMIKIFESQIQLFKESKHEKNSEKVSCK